MFFKILRIRKHDFELHVGGLYIESYKKSADLKIIAYGFNFNTKFFTKISINAPTANTSNNNCYLCKLDLILK